MDEEMAYWLVKSEPDEFSIDDLEQVNLEPWTGVRNYQARNYMRDSMKAGDGVFFYHSNCDQPGIVGLAEVAGDSYPDPTQFQRKSPYFDPASSVEEPRWMLVDVLFKRHLKRCISLAELKTHEALAEMALVRKGNRLSVMPVSKADWNYIMKLEKKS